jgi:hypothetical protein
MTRPQRRSANLRAFPELGLVMRWPGGILGGGETFRSIVLSNWCNEYEHFVKDMSELRRHGIL